MPKRDDEVINQRIDQNGYQRAYRKARFDAGICIRCDNARRPNRQTCQYCAEHYNKWQKNNGIRRISDGKCLSCGKMKDTSDGTTCSKCRAVNKDRFILQRLTVLNHYGSKCACCGETEEMFLCIDHKNNDGAAHRKEIGTGSRMMKWIIDNGFPDTFQVLCQNCNIGKYLNGGVCPHQETKDAVRI